MINDNKITDWSATDTVNLPTDGTFIGRDLPKQVRNIKSIVREEFDLRWMGYTSAPTYVTSTSFTVPGNVTTTFVPFLKLRFHAGSGLSYAMVLSSSHASGTTTVNIINLSGSLAASVSRVDLGIGPSVRAYHERARFGNVVISGTNSTINVTWSSLSLPDMPGSYPVHARFHTSSGSVSVGSLRLKDARGTEASFDITIDVAPGVGTSVTYNWVILYPWHTEFPLY